MSKSTIFLSLFFMPMFFIFNATAQTKSPRIIAGLGGGIAHPTGKFATKEIYDEKSGFANEGFWGSLDASYVLDKNYGVCGTIKIGSFPLDVLSLANGYASILGGKFNLSSQRWNLSAIHGGAFITIPIKKLHIDLKMMPGLMSLSYPEVIAESSQYYFVQKSTPSTTICFSAGGTIRYTLSEIISMGLSVETLRAKPTFDVDVGLNGNQDLIKIDQPVSFNTLGICLYYNVY